ncbi:MAG: 3D domain-containing protein [Fidelibacterota bacterium]
MSKNKKHLILMKIYLVLIILMTIPMSNGCMLFQERIRPPFLKRPKIVTMQVTAYCACQKCTGWKYNWLGRRVYAYGPQKGKPKEIGLTASGTKACRGIIAADTDIYPMGTIMFIEGYGFGRVEDRGSAIKGHHIDLFFKSHDRAMEWGNKIMKVKVWKP